MFRSNKLSRLDLRYIERGRHSQALLTNQALNIAIEDRHTRPADMGVSKSSSLTLMLVVVAVDVVCGGHIDVDTCPISTECLQCISGQSSEVERCIQLQLFISQTTNHDQELHRYCNGTCPIILATAHYYCNKSEGIQSLFDVCESYSVEPTGKEDFDRMSTCSARSCDVCVHGHSEAAMKCLQYQLLTQNTNNTSYRGAFCAGDCPLTLSTSNWYCGHGETAIEPFQECKVNEEGNFCNDFTVSEVVNDPDILRCTSNRNSCPLTNCSSAVNKYGCCLISEKFPSDLRNFFANNCDLEDCKAKTGGSSPNYATPPLVWLALAGIGLLY